MSDTFKDQEFLDLADAFIDLANQKCAKINSGKVSAAFLYAAARFNTYIVASGAENAQAFEQSKQSAMDYFMQEYEKMLLEHMGDYANNFDAYVKSGNHRDLLN